MINEKMLKYARENIDKSTYYCFTSKIQSNTNKQGLASDTNDTNPLAQNYLVWANTELVNVMTYNNYVNEETKSL